VALLPVLHHCQAAGRSLVPTLSRSPAVRPRKPCEQQQPCEANELKDSWPGRIDGAPERTMEHYGDTPRGLRLQQKLDTHTDYEQVDEHRCSLGKASNRQVRF
jgi:hypothetical protein